MYDYAQLFSLRGRIALVAGGTGAIGFEMAQALASQGARVVIAGRSQEKAQEMATLIGNADQAMGLPLEVTDEVAISDAFQAVTSRWGAPDILINSAGTHIEQPSTELSMEAWDTVMDVNLRGAFLLSQAAAQGMVAEAKEGSIVHVTSVRSTLGIRRGYAAYVASKGGLGILIKQLACEWAHLGIRVNGIGPTFTRTPLVEGYLGDPSFYDPLVARIPMGRVCETRDLAGIAIFLASPASSFITGQNILVDGGITATQ